MQREIKKLPASFYQTASGAEPVRAWLKGLAAADRGRLGHDIGLVEFGWPVGMPLCRSLGDGLWEVRSNLEAGRIARVIFCVAQERMVLLHGFVKKSQKTPGKDLTLALRRKRELA